MKKTEIHLEKVTFDNAGAGSGVAGSGYER